MPVQSANKKAEGRSLSPCTPAMTKEPVTKRRKKTGLPDTSPVTPVEIISLLDSDDDDDDVVMNDGGSDDIEVVPVVAPVAVALQSSGLEDGDDDLQAVGVIQTAPVYPHSRAECRQHVFAAENSDKAHEQNIKTCDKCYCFVCDDEASKCNAWESHCMASDKRTAWRNLRTKKRAKPGQPIEIPSLLLPPKLRERVPRVPVRNDGPSRRVQGNLKSFFSRIPLRGGAVRSDHLAKCDDGGAQREDGLLSEAEKARLSQVVDEMIAPAHKEFVFRSRSSQRSSSKALPQYIRSPSDQKYLVGVIDFWRPYCSHRKGALPQDATMLGVELGYFELAGWAGKSKNTAAVLAAEMGLEFNRSPTFWERPSLGNLRDQIRCGAGGEVSAAERRCFCEAVKLVPSGSEKRVNMAVTANREPIADYVSDALNSAVTRGMVSIRWEAEHYSGSEKTNKANALACHHDCLSVRAIGDENFAEVSKGTIAWREECELRLKGVEKLNDANCCRLRAWISLLPAAFSSNNVRVATDVADPSSPYAFHSPVDGGAPQCSAPVREWGTKFADFSRGPLSLSPTSFLPRSFETPLLKSSRRGVIVEDKRFIVSQEALYSSRKSMLAGGTGGQKLFSIEGILASPIFTVSEGYVGGAATQPKSMVVSLRPYQLETLKWMLDQEKKTSISDVFWVKLTMAPIVDNKIAKNGAAKWEPFWFCPLTGGVSRIAPPKVVGGILSEEMGLGKTVEVISLLTETVPAARAQPVSGLGTTSSPVKCGATLIITPVSLLKQWQAELARRAAPGALNVCFWYGSSRPKDPAAIAKYDVLLTTYSTMASSHSQVLECLQFYRIVIDESTYLKGGANTSMYSSLMRLRSTRRWAVSGTPFANNIKALLPIMRFLGVSPFAQDRAFTPLADDFNERLSRGYDPHATDHMCELPVIPAAALAFVLKSLMMRHCKRQELNGRVLVELPASTGRMVKVTLSDVERKAYDETEREACSKSQFLLRDEKTVNKNIIALNQLLYPVRLAANGIARSVATIPMPDGSTKNSYSTRPVVSCSAKTTQLLKDIAEIREKDPVSKFCVFTESDPQKEALHGALLGASVGVLALEGNMTAQKRGRVLADMAEDVDKVVLLLSMKFAHGLNLIFANVIVFLEPSLSQEAELQACDRVRRIGQTKSTLILTYCASQTVDERVLAVRSMRGHSRVTGEEPPKTGGNENLPHRLRFCTYLQLPYGSET